jgi:hypothetical protein
MLTPPAVDGQRDAGSPFSVSRRLMATHGLRIAVHGNRSAERREGEAVRGWRVTVFSVVTSDVTWG